MPAAGHMVHMPSHIYMRVGRYADAARVNVLADTADDDYVAQCRAQGIYPFFYHRHNEHMLAWAAMFQGRSVAALEAARKIGHGVEPSMVGGPMSETVQHLLSQPLYVLVRFGRWQEVLREPAPPAQYTVTTAMWHYARGMALSHTGDPAGAASELAALRRIAADPALKDRGIGFASLPVVLAIGTEVLAAQMDAARGRRTSAVHRLERAVRLQDGLRYNEPPDWYFPARHYLGAALLEAGQPAEAETVYWQDLARNRENGYALFGLARAIRAQGRTAEAEAIEARFRTAWKDADVTLQSSRF
jgi:tetratricopeptide (TPR) repeat protein